MFTDQRFEVLARKFRFISMRCRHVDADNSIFWFRSIAVAATAVACNTFVQSVNGDRGAAPTTIGRALGVVESRRL